jgi:hypothetical protein
MHIWVDHVEPKTEIQVEQVQWIFKGPQVSSYEDANIVMIKTSPGALNQYSLSFILKFVLCSIMIVH